MFRLDVYLGFEGSIHRAIPVNPYPYHSGDILGVATFGEEMITIVETYKALGPTLRVKVTAKEDNALYRNHL